jgi:hypothetical protein
VTREQVANLLYGGSSKQVANLLYGVNVNSIWYAPVEPVLPEPVREGL